MIRKQTYHVCICVHVCACVCMCVRERVCNVFNVSADETASWRKAKHARKVIMRHVIDLMLLQKFRSDLCGEAMAASESKQG